MAKTKLNQFDLQTEQDRLKLLQAQAEEYRKASAFIREWNKLNQQAKKDTQEQLQAAKEIQKKHAGFTKELKAQNELVSELGDLYDDQIKQQKKILDNFDDVDDTFTSILSKAGKNNKLADALDAKYEAIRRTTNTISTVLGDQNELSEHQIDNIVTATNKYKNFQSILADGRGNRTQEEYNELIKDSYKEFDELFHKIDDTTEAGKQLKAILAAARGEMESFNKAAERSSNTLKGMDMAMDQFSGVPMMSEFGDVIKSATQGGGGLIMALAAMGAAAGALAYNLGLVGDKVGDMAKYDKNIVGLTADIDVANQKLEMGAFGGRNFVVEKAMNSMRGQMQQMAASFEAASKTALFGKGLGSVGYGAAQLSMAGISAEQIADSMTAASDATGKMPSSKVAADMAVMAARTGQSGESIASINDMFQRMDGASEKSAMNLSEGLRAMAKSANINLGGLMTEMAESSKEMLGYQIKSGTALAKQITYARSLGVSFSDIAKAGQSMVLNYKDSIKSEMQLSAMLGKNVDLSEVRSKFASGDTEGALQALKAQGLNPADMDMFQQQQLQQATGMNLTDLQKISTRSGANVGGLGEGNAKAGNETFLSAKSSAEIGLQMAQAMISAKTQIQDTLINKDLEKAKQDALMNNTGGLNALTVALNQETAKKDAEIAAKTGGFALGGGLLGGGIGLLGNLFKGKGATAAAEGGAGVVGKAGGMLGKAGGMLGKAGKLGGKLLGKVAAPLAIAMSIYDGFKGFTADADASTGQKFKNAGSSILNGLTFGLLGQDSDEIAADAAKRKGSVTPAQVAAVTPGNTSVTTAAANYEKWMQTKLTKMSGNLERVVDRTTKSMIANQQASQDIKIMSANTIAILNLTKNIEALTAATYEGGNTAVRLSLDGKVLSKSYTKYASNTNGSDPTKK
jgi:hypothetical protein